MEKYEGEINTNEIKKLDLNDVPIENLIKSKIPTWLAKATDDNYNAIKQSNGRLLSVNQPHPISSPRQTLNAALPAHQARKHISNAT